MRSPSKLEKALCAVCFASIVAFCIAFAIGTGIWIPMAVMALIVWALERNWRTNDNDNDNDKK